MRSSLPTLLTALLLVTHAPAQQAGVWPDFRGPHWNGHVYQTKVPLKWSEKHNVAWKTKIAGLGWSTPVVFQDRAFMTSATPKGHEMSVVGVDLKTGKKVVERTLFEIEKPRRRNGLNSYASPSPVIEKGRVYVHFGSYGTACLNTKDGKTIWERRDLSANHMEGPGSSPVLWKNLLIFNVDGGDVQYVIALNKKNGKTKWKTPRTAEFGRLPPDYRKAYSTPILIEVDGKTQLISSGAQATMAYDPKTGKEIWKLNCQGFSLSSRPVYGNGLLYINSGYMRPSIVAISPKAKGLIDPEEIVWTYKRGVGTMPSPVLVDGRLYIVSDSGRAACLDAKDGERLWRKRMDAPYCSSLLYAAGRIYFFDREGKTTVLKPGDKYEELASNQLDDGFMASPVVIGNAFLLRSKTHLYRIEEMKVTKPAKKKGRGVR